MLDVNMIINVNFSKTNSGLTSCKYGGVFTKQTFVTIKYNSKSYINTKDNSM